MNSIYDFIYEQGVGRWLWQLYRYGPLRLGFWGGLSDAEVCARMTGNTETTDWILLAASSCSKLISRAFLSFTVFVQSVLYVVVLYILVTTCRELCISRMSARAFAHELIRFQHQELIIKK